MKTPKLPILKTEQLAIATASGPDQKILEQIQEMEGLIYSKLSLREEILSLKDSLVDILKDPATTDLTLLAPNNESISPYDYIDLSLEEDPSGKDLLNKILIALEKRHQTDTDRTSFQMILESVLDKCVILITQLQKCKQQIENIEKLITDQLPIYEVYISNINKKVRSVLEDILSLKHGIRTANITNNSDVISSNEEIASKYDIEADDLSVRRKIAKNLLNERFGSKKISAHEAKAKFEEIGNLVETDTLAAYVNYQRELTGLVKMLNQGKIVETSYIRDIITQAMPTLTKNPPGIVYLHGDFGSGKTAIAVHIAQTRFKKQPLIISGSKFLEPDRLTEEFRIQGRPFQEIVENGLRDLGLKVDLSKANNKSDMIATLVGTKQEVIDKILDRRNQDRVTSNVTATEEQLNQEKIDISKMVDETFANPIQGQYVLGAMYQCMKEGRPLIIDEANAITPEVLISFNDLMTKKFGEKVQTRTKEGDITVKEGFCVIWTGNTGSRYKQARFNDTDAATFSRLTPIEVRYLPQSNTVNNQKQLFARVELDRIREMVMAENKSIDGIEGVDWSGLKANALSDQIFQVLVIKLLNRRKCARLMTEANDPFAIFKEVYKLSMAARNIMNIFEGIGDSFPADANLKRLIGDDTFTTIKAKLQKANLTMRGLLDKIIATFLSEGQSLDLEYYIFNFVKELGQYPEEMVILYTIFQHHGFFLTAGWPSLQDYATLSEFKKDFAAYNPSKKVSKYQHINVNGDSYAILKTKDPDGKSKYVNRFFSSLEITQLVFGLLPPRRLDDYIAPLENLKKQDEAENSADLIDQIKEKLEELESAFNPRLFEYKFPLTEGEQKTAERSEKIINEIIFFQTELQKRLDLNQIALLKPEEIKQKINAYIDYILEYFEPLLLTKRDLLDQVRSNSGIDKISDATALLQSFNN